MTGELAPRSIREIKLAAAKEIQNHILARIGEVEIFPTTQLRGEKGYLIGHIGVIVDHGVPKGDQSSNPVVRDAVVLLPKGLFVGPPVKTPVEGDKYSLTVPALDQLQPAPLEVYLEYGERALTALDVNIQTQVPR